MFHAEDFPPPTLFPLLFFCHTFHVSSFFLQRAKILQLFIGCDMFPFANVKKREILCEFEMKGAMLFLGERKMRKKFISI